MSRHVKSLEISFGVPVLVRSGHGLELTAEGARLADRLAAAFSVIDAAVEDFRPGPLVLSCSSTFMMAWLIPRISSFNVKHPNVNLQINTNFDQVDFARDKIAVAVRNTMIAAPRDVVVRKAIPEWVGPVCSPEYAGRTGLQSPAHLARARRLSTRSRPAAWAEWAGVQGYGGDLEVQDLYDHFYLLIQAAACGLGVAIVPYMLIIDDLRSGKLVAPWGFVSGPRETVLWIAPHLRLRTEVKALVGWLSSELQTALPDCAAAAARPATRPPVRPPQEFARFGAVPS